MKQFLAFDFGAESGRAMQGTLADGRFQLEEIHRFPNQPVRLPTGLYWDTLRLFHEIRQGLAIAGRQRKLKLSGIGVDTWGVDFALLGPDGALVDNPRHYRDSRNNGMPERAFGVVPREQIYRQTGLQFMQINTLYQLYALKLAESPALGMAETLLFMPDLFAYWLTGVKKAELTIASTSQFYNPAAKRWATELFDALDLPKGILPPIAQPGSLLGPLLGELSEESGLDDVPVFATAGHDTASAVAAVPASGDRWVYISSGTWSLMGVELDEPVLSDEALALNLTNEIGAEGKVRLLKNIAGLWLWQECRRAWAAEGAEYTYDQMTRMAAAAEPFQAVIDPDAFLEPGQMPQKIASWCRRTGQQPPDTTGGFCRVILESLALRYRQVLESIEQLLGHKMEVIHIVGGGGRNQVLNQFVADCTRKPVIAGPAEATATGNMLVQAMGSGDVKGLAELRQIVKRSFPVTTTDPRPDPRWDEAYHLFKSCGS
jgi:rhamnulokinase